MGFIRFMSGGAGRWVRIVAGGAIVAAGLVGLNGIAAAPGGIVLAAIGVVPLAAGVFDFCIFAPLASLPLAGPAIRSRLQV